VDLENVVFSSCCSSFFLFFIQKEKEKRGLLSSPYTIPTHLRKKVLENWLSATA